MQSWVRELSPFNLSRHCFFDFADNHEPSTIAIDFMKNDLLLVGDTLGSVKLFDLSQWELDPRYKLSKGLAAKMSRRPASHGNSDRYVSIGWYPVDNGLFQTTTRSSAQVQFWDASEFKIVTSVGHSPSVLTASKMSPLCYGSSATVAVGTSKGDIKLCDPSAGISSHIISDHNCVVNSLDWSPTDIYCLASSFGDGSVCVWDVRMSGRRACLHSFDWKQDISSSIQMNSMVSSHISDVRNRAHSKGALAVKYDSSGKKIISSGNDGRIRIWDLDGNLLPNYISHNFVSHIPYDLTVISGRNKSDLAVVFPFDSKGTVAVQNISTEADSNPIFLNGHMSSVHSLAFRYLPHQSGQLITAGTDKLLLAWDMQNNMYDTNNFGAVAAAGSANASRARGNYMEDVDYWSEEENNATDDRFEERYNEANVPKFPIPSTVRSYINTSSNSNSNNSSNSSSNNQAVSGEVNNQNISFEEHMPPEIVEANGGGAGSKRKKEKKPLSTLAALEKLLKSKRFRR